LIASMAESDDRATVTMTTGMRASICRSCLKTSRPDWSGRRRSRRITSGQAAATRSSPSAPVCAISTRYAGAGNTWLTRSRSRAESAVCGHDGRWVWIKVVGKVVERDSGGRPLRLALAVRNIDDLRQAEQQLRERERQLESLMGHLPGLAYRALADEHWTALFA